MSFSNYRSIRLFPRLFERNVVSLVLNRKVISPAWLSTVFATHISGGREGLDIQRAVINARHGRVRRPGLQLVRVPGPWTWRRNETPRKAHRAVTSLSYRGTNVCMQVQHARALKCNTAYAIMWETCEPSTCLRARCFLYLGGAIFFFVAALVGCCKYRLCARVNAHTRSRAFIYLVINDVFPATKGGINEDIHIHI